MKAGASGWRAVAVSTLLVSSSVPVFTQSSSELAFDVASVRVALARTPSRLRITDTRVDIMNMPMRSVLLTAFRVEPFQLVAPDWVDRTRIDIQATIPAGRSRRDVPEMLRTLLENRFGLTAHVEQRPLETYELHVAKGGHTMTEVPPVDELSQELQRDTSAKEPTTTVSETVDGPIRNSMIPLGQRRITTRTRYDRIFTERQTTLIDATRISMTELVSVLASTLDQPVRDMTGLTSLYQFKIELPPDATATKRLLALGFTTTVKGTPLSDPTGVSVFKSLEGLGLTLEKRRSPGDVVVVDELNSTPASN